MLICWIESEQFNSSISAQFSQVENSDFIYKVLFYIPRMWSKRRKNKVVASGFYKLFHYTK